MPENFNMKPWQALKMLCRIHTAALGWYVVNLQCTLAAQWSSHACCRTEGPVNDGTFLPFVAVC